MVARDEDDVEDARNFLEDLTELARIHDAKIVVGSGEFREFIAEAPRDDVSIFGLAGEPSLQGLYETVDLTGSSCIFVRDSGNESALA